MFCSLVVSIACIVATLSHGLPTDRLFFYETFNGDDVFATGKFVKFGDAKYADQPVLVKTPKMSPNDMPEDKGLSLSQEMKHYGFGTKFPEPLSMKSQNELVIQYEVKLEETLNCGGAYIKLPQYHVEDVGAMHSETPYTIMFGPDKCGSGTNKVHFILQHKNPITGVYEEKHCTETPSVRSDKKTHLYTLIIRRDNSFEILVDQKSQKKGTLLTDMVPSINPPEEVDDPMDSMPEDWVTEPKMPDPDATKPEDWDEDAPRMIDDPTAVKPAAWLDDAPLKIPDPQYSEKPADWDDEEDGSYEAPLIDNPDCELSGCGQWNPPKIKNPSFKGKWAAPMIDNPAYKGPWAPRKIPNKV
jgi:calnexin